MLDPWILVCTGSTFEHTSIYKWVVRQGNRTDPQTNEPLDSPQMTKNSGLRRTIRDWCDDEVLLLKQEDEAIRRSAKQSASSRPRGSGSRPKKHVEQAHIFVDDSNLMLGGASPGLAHNIDIGKFAKHVEREVVVEERVVVGSGHLRKAEWEAALYTVIQDPRRGKEFFVDEALIAQMTKTASREFEPRRTLILVTGDGNANAGRHNFPEALEAALRNKWRVRVYAWKGSAHRNYVAMASEYKAEFRLVYLDDQAAAFRPGGY
jgi:hypothetical protein